MEKMMLDKYDKQILNLYTQAGGEYGKSPIWESSEEYKLRKELENQQIHTMAQQWAKDFPWWFEKYTNESKERIQDSE